MWYEVRRKALKTEHFQVTKCSKTSFQDKIDFIRKKHTYCEDVKSYNV